jgi:hypothetical protein
MPILNNIANAFLGATQVEKIYRGVELIWQNFKGLLDLYPNAAVAYSLRRLRADYTGSAIRVRRSSDNAEQDIGFVSNVLDTASLLTFVGAGDGFVTTWYDQSGSGFNATQTTAISQPTIVLSGVVQTQGANPSPLFSSNSFFSLISSASVFNNANKILIQSVNKRNSTKTAGTIVSYSTGVLLTQVRVVHRQANLTYQSGGRRLDTDGFQTSTSTNIPLATPVIFGSYVDTSNRIIRNYINNAINGASTTYQTAGNISPTNSIGAFIGRSGTGIGEFFNEYIQEVVIYNTDQLANIAGIDANMNAFYGVY